MSKDNDTPAHAAGEFLVDVAERLASGLDPGTIRTVMNRACEGQLWARTPDGGRASTMITPTGIPFEASVTGGRGKVVPAVRYITEAATQETTFTRRLAAQLAAIRDLVAWLPDADRTVVEMLQSFVRTLYPDPSQVLPGRRSAVAIGVVHHPEAPRHIARLKIYGTVHLPGTMDRLCDQWPGFAGLAPAPDPEHLIVPFGAALEVDALGAVNHKIYSRAGHDVGIPMKLVRHFGDPAWEVLSELTACGVDPAELYRHQFFVCQARGTGDPTLALYVYSTRGNDSTELVRELASRHHGTTRAVDALVRAAESCGASWHYRGVGLTCCPANGFEKLNAYGVPTWEAATGPLSRSRSCCPGEGGRSHRPGKMAAMNAGG